VLEAIAGASQVTELLRVFVYGTLKPGECNYAAYCGHHVLEAQPAIALGQLYHLPVGYPAMTEGDRPVYGYVLSFTDSQVLARLDQLEDYDPRRSACQNEYIRVKSEVFDWQQQSLGQVWLYRMSRQQVMRMGGRLLSDGKWTGKTR
jgi:gamma-glutamylcyclotransferase (GGCT)/AIG2-like uncharacterized protein YtfP